MGPKATVGGKTLQPWNSGTISRPSVGMEIIQNEADANETMKCREEDRDQGGCVEVLWRRAQGPLITALVRR